MPNVWYIESLSNRDCTVIQTKIKGRDTIIASIYLDITLINVIPEWLDELIKYSDKNNTAILLCIDSNTHSTSFGVDTNKRGEKLDEFIAEYHLEIRNEGITPTFQTNQAQSIIDITLTKRMTAGIMNWTVDTAENFTDHNTITFNIATETITLPPTRNWNKADWTIFKDELQKRPIKIREVMTPQRLETLVDKFYSNINKSLDVACPLGKTKIIDKNNPWWSPELTDKRKYVAKLYKKQERHKTCLLYTSPSPRDKRQSRMPSSA